MIRFLRLFFWLRWKLFIGTLKEARSKGALSGFGAAASVLVLVLAGVVLAVVAVALSVAAFGGAGALAGNDPDARSATLLILRIVLLALFGLLLAMPAVRAGRGSFGKGSAGLTRLLLLPLSRRHLHAAEVAGNALDPFILAVLPALLVLGGTLALRLEPAAALLVGAAVMLLATVLMAWAALLGIALQLVFRDRKRAEWAMLITLLLTVGLSILPGIVGMGNRANGIVEPEIVYSGDAIAGPVEQPVPVPRSEQQDQRVRLQQPSNQQPSNQQPSNQQAERQQTERPHAGNEQAGQESGPVRLRSARRDLAARWSETFPFWLQWLPSEAFLRALSLATSGRWVAALPSLLSLMAFALGCWFVSLRLWDRLTRSPASSKSHRVADTGRLPLKPLPWLSAEVSCVAFATARGFLRTVRGKLAVAMTPMLVLLMGFVFSTGEGAVEVSGLFAALIGDFGSMLTSVAILMSLLNILSVLANAFATDGAGFTLQALAPISDRRIVWGKVLGSFFVFLACLVPSLILAEVWSRASPVVVLEGLARGFGAFALAAPIGIWSSVLFPKSVDLNSLGSQGNPHALSQLLSMLAMGLALLLGSVGGVVGALALGGSFGQLVGTVAVTLLLGLLGWPLLEVGATLLRDRWEVVATAASK